MGELAIHRIVFSQLDAEFDDEGLAGAVGPGDVGGAFRETSERSPLLFSPSGKAMLFRDRLGSKNFSGGCAAILTILSSGYPEDFGGAAAGTLKGIFRKREAFPLGEKKLPPVPIENIPPTPQPAAKG